MCNIPPPYLAPLPIHGSCALVPTPAGWIAAAAGGGVPVDGGTSVLRARLGPDQPWKAVFFTSANRRLRAQGWQGGLHARWFTQDNPNLMAFRHIWAQNPQTAQTAWNWCCLLAQVTALAGQPPIAPPSGPCLQGHPTHPMGNWEFSIRWWAAQEGVPLDQAVLGQPDAWTRAFIRANAAHVVVQPNLRGALALNPAFLADHLAAIGPCGCP